ncbi:bacteriocin immunity protein [Pseudomonas sp. LS1212]|uniref:bacteriocin immunity protein n=1 Tax=Pseudomonas sp. LS1212 TaxID=2972478 RepID=UPI00215BD371|nr:bacteriocin immunity protein [Pseudomonas sp. LS1212]UVJ45635.1 bacteriocin immunity protein [Pseudomonas sp. LS1212]
MAIKNFSEYTEKEFLLLVKKICNSEFTTEDEQIQAVLDFEQLTEHPDGSDLIYYAPSEQEATPEVILAKIKEWRAANGKPGFKPIQPE